MYMQRRTIIKKQIYCQLLQLNCYYNNLRTRNYLSVLWIDILVLHYIKLSFLNTNALAATYFVQ